MFRLGSGLPFTGTLLQYRLVQSVWFLWYLQLVFVTLYSSMLLDQYLVLQVMLEYICELPVLRRGVGIAYDPYMWQTSLDLK